MTVLCKDRPPPMDDIGKYRRPRMLKKGQIVFNSGSSLINCIIRDRFLSGARLQLPAPTLLPRSFGLLSVTEGMMYPAEIRWCRGDEVRIEFVGAPTPAPSTKRRLVVAL